MGTTSIRRAEFGPATRAKIIHTFLRIRNAQYIIYTISSEMSLI
jgi:hypothetical protein